MIKEAPETTGTVLEREPAEQPVPAPSSTATDEQLIATWWTAPVVVRGDRVRKRGGGRRG